jgi:hypothetical protein
VITSITAPCTTQGTALQAHAQPLQHHLQQMMRRFGRQCRGMGNVCVTRVRQTETPRWERGRQVLPLARAVQQRLHRMPQLSEDQRARLDTQLTAALAAPQRIEHPSRRRTQGKMLPHGKLVNADDPTMAPIGTGTSHGPAPFGRKPGMMAEPAAGCIVALHRPVGNPSDASDGEPLGDNVEQAIARVRTRPPPAIHALAGDLALHDVSWREAWHERGILPVGIPKTVDPLPSSPTPEDVLQILDEADLHHIRTPLPGAPGVCLWVQPTGRRKHHGQSAAPWSAAPHVQRPSWRHCATGHGRHGAPCGHLGPHPRVSSLEAGPDVPPTAAVEVP